MSWAGRDPKDHPVQALDTPAIPPWAPLRGSVGLAGNRKAEVGVTGGEAEITAQGSEQQNKVEQKNPGLGDLWRKKFVTEQRDCEWVTFLG